MLSLLIFILLYSFTNTSNPNGGDGHHHVFITNASYFSQIISNPPEPHVTVLHMHLISSIDYEAESIDESLVRVVGGGSMTALVIECADETVQWRCQHSLCVAITIPLNVTIIACTVYGRVEFSLESH
eukprot:PhF_6_TR33655/c0_g1_i1/m.49235